MIHRHKDLMLLYAEDTSLVIQQDNGFGEWFDLKRVGFFEDKDYRIKPKKNQVKIKPNRYSTFSNKTGIVIAKDADWFIVQFECPAINYSFKREEFEYCL